MSKCWNTFLGVDFSKNRGLHAKKWRLGDAEAMHRKHPRSFRIPKEKDRLNLQRGQEVKLLFLGNTTDPDPSRRLSERMWVRIVSRDIGGGYVGKLLNEPFVPVGGLKAGSLVRFRAKHVLDIG